MIWYIASVFAILQKKVDYITSFHLITLHVQSHKFKVLEKCTKNLIGHSRLAFNNHESNIDC